MKFFMEKNKDAGDRVTINIPKKTVNDAIVKEFIKINKRTNVNGFRKGKTPITLIQKKFGSTVYYDVFKQLMQKFFYEFLNKEKIKIIGIPKYYMHKNTDTQKEFLEYSVIYETFPKFQIKNLKNITVKKIIVNTTDEDIKNYIKKCKIKNNIWNIVNRSIKHYDRVTINYTIYENNQQLKQFDTVNMSFIVFENTLIPQLNSIIINRFVNDVIFFKIKFHKMHPETQLQNKEVVLKIKILKIETKQTKEQESNIQIQNQIIDDKTIKKNIDININTITKKYIENQIIQKIIDQNIILIPSILLQQEIKILHEKYKKQYEEKKHSILEKKYHINVEIKAKKRLLMRIIIENIISDYKLFINENDIDVLIHKLSLNYKNPIEIVNILNKNNNIKNIIRNIELEKKAMFLLKKSIQILPEYWNFDKFINYQWNNHEEFLA